MLHQGPCPNPRAFRQQCIKCICGPKALRGRPVVAELSRNRCVVLDAQSWALIGCSSSQLESHNSWCRATAARNRIRTRNTSSDAVSRAWNLAEASALQPLPILVSIALAAAAGTGILRATAYSQMEYITAAMLSRYTPKGKSADVRVIQLGGGTRDLFYYPKTTGLVNYVDDNANPSLMEQAGIQASIGVVGRKQSAASLSFATGSSQDAVVSLKALSKLSPDDRAGCLAEVARVLKPGAPFIFLEPIKEGATLLRPISGGSSSALGNDALEQLKTNSSFRNVQWDVALPIQDPHAVGVAFKQDLGASRGDTESGSQRKSKPKAAGKGTSAGFGMQ